MEKIKKEHKEEILEKINPDNYEISWNEKGVPYKFKSKIKKKRGKLSRARGSRFELRVRKNLEEQGWNIDKWSNNVDLENKKIIPAKRKFNPFLKALSIGTGFPDFISFKHIHDGVYSVSGVEVKINGVLSKEEKEKCRWYLKNKIFSKIWIARTGKKRGQIEYVDFGEKFSSQ